MNAAIPAIKFCGLTREIDIELACDLGVDYVGLVFARGSARCLDLGTARMLAKRLRAQPHRPMLVALLRDELPARVQSIIDAIAPDLLQFHGSESEPACSRYGRPYWKALGLTGVDDPAALVRDSHRGAEALLLDAHPPGAAGGTGITLDWTRWPRGDRALVLAGGLHPGNVAAAVALTRPFAVDVSSGIESAPGIKDPAAMRAFVEAVRGRVAPA